MYTVIVDYETKSGTFKSEEFETDIPIDISSVEVFNFVYNLIVKNKIKNFGKLIDVDILNTGDEYEE